MSKVIRRTKEICLRLIENQLKIHKYLLNRRLCAQLFLAMGKSHAQIRLDRFISQKTNEIIAGNRLLNRCRVQ